MTLIALIPLSSHNPGSHGSSITRQFSLAATTTMPDLTIEYYRMCVQLDYCTRIINEHHVTYNPRDPDGWHCDCKGFKFRRKCKHVSQAMEEQCSWHGAYDEGEAEAPDYKCPRCGGETKVVGVGV